jgi:hypothetical protein
MSSSRSPWGTALVVYAVYRRTLHKMNGKRGNPSRVFLLKIVFILMMLSFAGPILWRALLTMPTALAVFIGSAVVFRVVRWYWRRSR